MTDPLERSLALAGLEGARQAIRAVAARQLELAQVAELPGLSSEERKALRSILKELRRILL